ncbi:MAG TPA: inositol monophosphatase family protein [Nitrospiria bacterium]|jgi:myo-inositol-1(or 4)-monophosphatase
MEEYLKTASEVAQRAGKLLMNYLGKDLKIGYKGVINLITEADQKSEETIVQYLRAKYPDHQILAEEGKGVKTPSSWKWIIDPLDGTTNFAHGFPSFCVSIGLEVDEKIQVGVVYDPVRSHLFSAERGKGSFLNGEKLGVSSIQSLSESLLVTGFAYDARFSDENNFDHFIHFTRCCQGVRRTGSAALDLCYVALGCFDGFWELKLSPWDTAAGSLIAEEAGAKVSDFKGNPFSIYMKEILASNGKIHQEMIQVLTQTKP